MKIGLVIFGVKVNILWIFEVVLIDFLSDMDILYLNMYLYARNLLRSQTTLGLHTLVVTLPV